MSVFAFDRAIVRAPGPSVVRGLRAGAGESPLFEGVLTEHRAYVAALEAAGLRVAQLPALDAFPDSIFVEDPAFVAPEGAVLLNPGAPSRAGEAVELAATLRGQFGRVERLPRGHADGGDILILPDEILIGLSARTDRAGAEAFTALMRDWGRKARIVETPPGVLHFKTGCALLDEETVVAVPALAASGVFDGLNVLATPPGEEGAANMLRVNDSVLLADGFPRTAALLAARNYDPVLLPTAQIARIDAGLSCMSLRWFSGSGSSDRA